MFSTEALDIQTLLCRVGKLHAIWPSVRKYGCPMYVCVFVLAPFGEHLLMPLVRRATKWNTIDPCNLCSQPSLV